MGKYNKSAVLNPFLRLEGSLINFVSWPPPLRLSHRHIMEL